MAHVPKTIRLLAIAVAAILMPLLLASCGGGGGSAGEVPPDPIPLGQFSIGGTIAVSAGVAVDKDTNDPNAPASAGLDNDFPYDDPDEKLNIIYDGQLIPNPGTVGGFVAFENQGNPGPATTDTDWNDFYRVSLLEGQTISLVIADHIANAPTQVDLDLLLLDLDLNLVDVSAGVGPQESLTVADDGEYFVWVTVCADTLPVLLDDRLFICGNGASNYLLSVGQSETAAAVSGLRLSGDFVPGEALVRYRDTPPLAAAEEAAEVFSATASSVGTDALQVGNVRLFKFADEPLVASASAVSSGAGDRNTAGAKQPWLNVSAEQRSKLATIAKIKELAGQIDVALVEPNYMRQALQTSEPNEFEPNDPGYQYQWHYPLINLPAAWGLFGSDPMGMLGANVTVAVLDTGILPLHPDFENQLELVTGGYDFVSSVGSARDGNGVDPDPTDPGDSSFAGFSSSFHGTHVAGTIAAATNNGAGVAGIAPDARIMPIRVLGRDGGTSFDIRRGLCYAAGLSTGSNCSGVPVNPRPADVINLSLGGTDRSLLEESLITELLKAGVIVVASAGNSASSTPVYPAAYAGVIGVSAITLNQTLAPYSSFGEDNVDVAAPGGDTSQNIDGDPYVDGVVSTGGNDARGPVEYNYPFFQGTSMAAPHVAGVFALMRSANKDLDYVAISNLLVAGELTIPLGELNGGRNDSFGYGLIDAQKAVAAALASDGNPPAPQPWLGVFPRALNFGATLESLVITVRNNSGGDLNILSIESSEPWLTIPPLNGLTDYEVRVERGGLAEGSHSATLTVTSDQNDIEIPVIVQKSNTVLTGDAGHLYVRLIDPVTGNIREVETDVDDGEYAWQIDQLPPGEYQLVAYTDADNDNRLCDPGEACGSYLTATQLFKLELTSDQGNLTDLDFQVSFGVGLSDPDSPGKP